MSVDRILLTNDDGIDAVGLRAMHDALSADYDVVTVAPTDDQSSTGRTLSEGVTVTDHDLGYAVDGTPVDCVVAGLDELVSDADLVVAGCNEGANLGAYTLGRSGTVSAAVEAAFFNVPAVAASMYVPGDEDWWKREWEPTEFANATQATKFLIDRVGEGGIFDRADYLNINAPIAEPASVGADGGAVSRDDRDGRAPMRVTTPSEWYGIEATRNGDGSVGFSNPIWGRMTAADVPDPVGTDRRAIVDGEVSVSPLSVPHEAASDSDIAELADAYGEHF